MLPYMTQCATTMLKRWVVSAALVLVVSSAPAEAQFLEAFQESGWGVHLSYTPAWESPDPFRYLLGADEVVDWKGTDFSVGFARGRATAGEWGLSFVRQQVETDSLICLGADGGGCADPVVATDGLRLQGLAFHWFTPLARFAGDRVQIGVNAGAGAGWYDGGVLRPAVAGGPVDAADVLRLGGPGGTDGMPVPMFRVELAVGGAVAPGLRLMASGGYGLPGTRRVGVSLTYFPLGD